MAALGLALEPFNPFWYEDPIKMDNLDAIAEYAHRTDVWVTASETLRATEANEGSSSALKSYAQNTLPALHSHFDVASRGSSGGGG